VFSADLNNVSERILTFKKCTACVVVSLQNHEAALLHFEFKHLVQHRAVCGTQLLELFLFLTKRLAATWMSHNLEPNFSWYVCVGTTYQRQLHLKD